MSSRCKHTSLSECHPVSIWACKPVSLLPCEGVRVWDRVSMSVQIRVHVTFLLAYGPVIVSACHPVSVSQSSTIRYVIVLSGCQHVSMQVYQPLSVNLTSAYKLCPSTCARNGSLSISVRASNVALMNAMPRQHESRFFKTASLFFFFSPESIYLLIYKLIQGVWITHRASSSTRSRIGLPSAQNLRQSAHRNWISSKSLSRVFF